jgi:hypothetical protein
MKPSGNNRRTSEMAEEDTCTIEIPADVVQLASEEE